MTLQEIYEKAIEVGLANDWRGKACIDGILERARNESSNPGFDPERLHNPYGDTRIVVGDPDTPVSHVLVGIDVWPSEVLLAGVMRNAGKPVDLCFSHHTTCVNRGMFNFADILLTHKYSLQEVGVPKEKYDPPVDKWIADPGNVWKLDTINTARNLDIPLIVIHTPCDLIHVRRTRDLFRDMVDRPLAEIAGALNATEEFRLNPYEEVVIHGDVEAKPGKVYNSVGAGWRPKVELFALACEAGIDTAVLVGGNLQEYLEVAAAHGVNIFQMPPNPNCIYGVNTLLDELERVEPLTIYEAENFTRVRRL